LVQYLGTTRAELMRSTWTIWHKGNNVERL